MSYEEMVTRWLMFVSIAAILGSFALGYFIGRH